MEPGTDIPYEQSPPACGTHYNVWDLERGYTLLWYDETVTDNDEAMDQLRSLSSKFTDDDNFRNKFQVVPWTSEDGEPFPEGQHVAITHWSVGGDGDLSDEQTGVTQYCSDPSGAALEQFMKDHPYTDSPELGAIWAGGVSGQHVLDHVVKTDHGHHPTGPALPLVSYGVTPWTRNASYGSTGSPPPGRTSRWRWEPVTLPVEPM